MVERGDYKLLIFWIRYLYNKKNIDMDVQSIKVDLIHWLTELQDKAILRQLQELKEKQESSVELNEEHQKELDLRLEKYMDGKMSFSSWDSVKVRLRENAKDAL